MNTVFRITSGSDAVADAPEEHMVDFKDAIGGTGYSIHEVSPGLWEIRVHGMLTSAQVAEARRYLRDHKFSVVSVKS